MSVLEGSARIALLRALEYKLIQNIFIMDGFKKLCQYYWQKKPEVIIVRTGHEEFCVGIPKSDNKSKVYIKQCSNLKCILEEVRNLVDDNFRVIVYRENGNYAIPDPEKIETDKKADY